jgi:diguanylate cyclase (GGDEF)-like protein
MARHASYDALTGLLNRRALYQRFCMEAERSMRNGLPMSIAVLDIDYFKRFNDNHGHLIGDTILRELSDFLSQHIRRSDVLSRYGGEEFVILLPETNADEAWELIDRLREMVSSRICVPTANRQEFLPITFSAGVSPVNLPTQNRLAAQTLKDPEWKLMLDVAVSHADQALYEAKNNGRNQVRCAS